MTRKAEPTLAEQKEEIERFQRRLSFCDDKSGLKELCAVQRSLGRYERAVALLQEWSERYARFYDGENAAKALCDTIEHLEREVSQARREGIAMGLEAAASECELMELKDAEYWPVPNASYAEAARSIRALSVDDIAAQREGER